MITTRVRLGSINRVTRLLGFMLVVWVPDESDWDKKATRLWLRLGWPWNLPTPRDLL